MSFSTPLFLDLTGCVTCFHTTIKPH